MTVRSVTVRYAADVTSLIAGLDRAATANARLAGSTDATQKKIDNHAKAAVGLTLAVGYSIAKFAEFDAAMSQAAAASGAGAAELGKLRDAAIQAGADTQYSATEAAHAITELSKAGVSTSDILGGALTGSLSLAAAGQMDVADAAEIAATAMTQFKLKGTDVTHIADLLAAGANNAQGSVGDLGMALKQSGLIASQTGLSIEETTAGLTAFASAGLIGSDAGTSFKTMLQRLTPQSAEAQAMMDKLGISAYDAQGNFIGLANFAGNLQNAMRDLTPQQRSAAMSVIFGSDAVRAANVLYEQGADGIQKWTDKTNQAGYAAKQAAALTDNLKGDLERLQGSLDTVLIQGGSGANGVLRTLTQTAEALVNGIGQLPGPLLLGAAAFGIFSLAGRKVGQLAGQAFAPAATGMANMRRETALLRNQIVPFGPQLANAGQQSLTFGQRVQTGAQGASRALGGLKGAGSSLMGLFGGPWGIALMGATTALAIWGQEAQKVQGIAQQLNGTLDQTTGAFTKASTDSLRDTLLGDLSADDQRLLQGLGVDFNALAKAAAEGGPAYAAQRQKLVELMNSHQGITEIFSSESFATEGLLRSYDRVGAAADTTRERQKIIEEGNKGVAGSANAAETGMGGAADAIAGVGTSADSTAPQVDTMQVLLGKLGAKSEETQTSLDALKTALDLLGGGTRALAAASDQQAAAIDKVAEASDKAKDAIKKKTDKDYTAAEKARDVAAANREYREALRGVATDTLDRIGVMQKENKSVGELTTAYDIGRSAIEKQLKAHGLHGKALQAETDKIIGTKGQFKLLLDEYAKTPAQAATTIKTPGLAESKKGIQGYWEVINGVPTFHKTNVTAPGAGTAKSQLRDVWTTADGIPNYVEVNVNITSNVRTAVANVLSGLQTIARASVGGGARSARGNIIHAFAGGGLDVPNGHVAEIATTGTRMWAEPETQGEAYIPFANDWRRPRAKAIATETVKRLGGDVAWHAAGGLYTPFAGGGLAKISSSDLAAVRAMVAALQDPLKAIADAAKALAAEQKKLPALFSRVNTLTKPVNAARTEEARAKARLTAATQDNDGDKKRQAALKARLVDLKKAADATKGVTAADRAYKAAQEALARVNLQVTASSKAKTDASKAYSAAQAKTKAATDKLKDAQSALADQQKAVADAQAALVAEQQRVADEAGRVAESFRSTFDPKSVDPKKWIADMTKGAGDLTAFLAKIQKLRAGGLAEELVQKIVDAGVQNGGRLADNILADPSSIGGLNSSWGQLLGASNNLGLGVVSNQLTPQVPFDYGKLAQAVVHNLPIKAIADTLGGVGSAVESGAKAGMLAAQAEQRRYDRSA
jgi:TP901 family phage tail tape measure protein